ncbi:hypothetical protein IMG5_201670 [Ichthyophthirius multifiliis]|uniref:Uncharacterized protein n=1 Tax=Ichthyophthirius multifiliis TaxID=5932 RepID=G0R5W5_ICHMU|nr:hypothetical protein IMG5_201670 [Ichthyophthirius multifiliis]EGR27142.1 hypothetical protein IMG5_201670 [Ichthyophthirius multifiliis]|eukprot:XP_004024026.1 hypothetical protein IMG5_201670 [Ichthyophthirius multifiliis]
MDKLQLPHAKLFYYSAELYKNGTISENEKLKLKEMVINDEPEIFEILESYQSNGNESYFTNGLLCLLRPNQKHLYQTQNTQNDKQSYEIRRNFINNNPSVPEEQKQKNYI